MVEIFFILSRNSSTIFIIQLLNKWLKFDSIIFFQDDLDVSNKLYVHFQDLNPYAADV
jgi:hypothetical protein